MPLKFARQPVHATNSLSKFFQSKRGQAATELIVVMPLFIILFFALTFVGEYSIETLRVKMASHYSLFKIRKTDLLTMPAQYPGISARLKSPHNTELPADSISSDNVFFFDLIHTMSNIANNTREIEISSIVEVPRELSLAGAHKVEIRESCAIDKSTWKISDMTALLKTIFKIGDVPHCDYGE